VAAFAAQRTGKLVRPIAKLFRCALDTLLGDRRDNRASGASLSTIDTVVEENPLSFATSRIVTIEALPTAKFLYCIPLA